MTFTCKTMIFCTEVIPVQSQNLWNIKTHYEIKIIVSSDFHELITNVSLNCFLPGKLLSQILI